MRSSPIRAGNRPVGDINYWFVSIRLAVLTAAVLTLFGCAGGQVDYLAQTTAVFTAVPTASVTVADRPPRGRYEVLGLMSAEQLPGETLAHAASRLQAKAAEMGANYVWVIGVSNNHYIAPGYSDTFSSASANASGQEYIDAYGNYDANGYGTASGNAMTINMPAHGYTLIGATAKALRVTGDTGPDMTKPASIGNPNEE